jgi:hypothetical protein
VRLMGGLIYHRPKFTAGKHIIACHHAKSTRCNVVEGTQAALYGKGGGYLRFYFHKKKALIGPFVFVHQNTTALSHPWGKIKAKIIEGAWCHFNNV